MTNKFWDRLFCFAAGVLWAWVCIAIMIVLGGCASTDEYEREDRYNQVYDRWLACRELYERHNVPWITYDPPRRGVRPRVSQLTSDIVANNCPRI